MDALAALIPSVVMAALFIGVMVTIFRGTDPRRSRDDARKRGGE
ncbi:hypothetical protein [Yinghuangia sp. ASG 101]|nr:hypothetical protein [Yinghuangia sp. ASG 101]